MSIACKQITSTPGCLVEAGQPPVPVIIFTEFGLGANGQVIPVATRYTMADATPIALTGSQQVTPGACPVVKTDAEFVLLCDTTGPANAPIHTSFVRRIERAYNAGTGTLITQTVTDLAPDMVTPYVVAGTVTTDCKDDHEFSEMMVCDSTGASYVRRYVMINGTMVTLGFFDPTTDAVSTPNGAVGPCPSCAEAKELGVLATWG